MPFWGEIILDFSDTDDDDDGGDDDEPEPVRHMHKGGRGANAPC
jgi:hypothetical protein